VGSLPQLPIATAADVHPDARLDRDARSVRPTGSSDRFIRQGAGPPIRPRRGRGSRSRPVPIAIRRRFQPRWWHRRASGRIPGRRPRGREPRARTSGRVGSRRRISPDLRRRAPPDRVPPSHRRSATLRDPIASLVRVPRIASRPRPGPSEPCPRRRRFTRPSIRARPSTRARPSPQGPRIGRASCWRIGSSGEQRLGPV